KDDPMSRRHSAEKREINPDPKYGNLVVSKLMNVIMRAGKKSVAEGIVYGALEIIETKTKQNPVAIFEQALDNVMPSIEVRSRGDLPGAGRGARHAPAGARDPLDHRGRARAQRKDDDGTALGGAARCLQQPGKCRQEARGHASHGRGQPGVFALSLVMAAQRSRT